ncbi:HD domain-containing protein [Streptomyces sp. NPDC048275]|uniref:HD-GYP domain-containing protein n=1 Tax=Streptomyces sp. NPDC048275 TaxID=3155629 RepID=UPI0033DE7071
MGGLALAFTLWSGLDQRGTALAFGVLVVVGELTRWSGPEERESAPLGAAGALSYALLGESAGESTHHGVLQVVAVVAAAALLGCVPHVARGRGPTVDHLTRRVLTVAFAAFCFQPLYSQGKVMGWGGPSYALLLVALLVLTALCDAVLAAAMAHARTRWPFGPLLRDELRAMPGIGFAVCATGAVMSLGVAVVGLWALPVFSLPLLLTQLSFRRYAAVRVTYRQTITSLARATEIAGYTPAGHARRVATLSRAVGRELGLAEPDLTVLEYAALMHDIGQLSLVDPVPAGATSVLPADEQRRIALLGGAVVRQTGVDAEVAVVVERQADPYREQPVTARIVRAVNAYEEMAREAGPQGPLAALEKLRLATARDYQPEVVESLARVLLRGGLTLPQAG